MKTSFVDFYNENKIIPVQQNIKSKDLHYARRRYLCSSLGVPDFLLRTARICEFGPGTGQNAEFFLSANTNLLTLVDGCDQAVERLYDLRSRFPESGVGDVNIVHCLFEEFSASNKFDIVWAEGCIPHQANPHDIVRKVAEHVDDAGILVVTTISGISHLSETVRRLYASSLLGGRHPEAGDVDNLTRVFEPHLQNLPGRTRYTADWCFDVIIQRLDRSSLFSLPEAVDALSSSFLPYHTLPALPSPFKWYKDYSPTNHLKHIKDEYYKSNLYLISNELDQFYHHPEDGYLAEQLGGKIWTQMTLYQANELPLKQISSSFVDLANIYEKHNKRFSANLNHIAYWLNDDCNPSYAPAINFLSHWWGRGQQYASFLRLK
jgi:2-polyprenyl-3-methyl-5-hydroxy-6-metoxy-1,4-benzoquinol methylase